MKTIVDIAFCRVEKVTNKRNRTVEKKLANVVIGLPPTEFATGAFRTLVRKHMPKGNGWSLMGYAMADKQGKK